MVYYGLDGSAPGYDGVLGNGLPGDPLGGASGGAINAATATLDKLYGGTTLSTTTTSSGTTTVIRVPTMTGYAKVQGWTPGKSLDELKSLVSCNEMEREGDLANIRGWGRRGRAAAAAANKELMAGR